MKRKRFDDDDDSGDDRNTLNERFSRRPYAHIRSRADDGLDDCNEDVVDEYDTPRAPPVENERHLHPFLRHAPASPFRPVRADASYHQRNSSTASAASNPSQGSSSVDSGFMDITLEMIELPERSGKEFSTSVVQWDAFLKECASSEDVYAGTNESVIDESGSNQRNESPLAYEATPTPGTARPPPYRVYSRPPHVVSRSPSPVANSSAKPKKRRRVY